MQVSFIIKLDGPSHKVDDFLKTILSQTKLTAPPLDLPTAFNILNLQPKDQQQNSKAALYRYYTLFKKNDPNNGGTVYMQSKVFAAKELIMNQYPNAAQLEQQFYKDVVQPQEREEERNKNKQESLNKDEGQQNNNKK